MSISPVSIVVGVGLLACPVASARPGMAERGPRPKVLQRIGHKAVDCGTFTGAPPFTHRELPNGAALKVSQCMTDAFRERKAFLFTVEMETVNQWMATGLMGTDKGAIEVFWYNRTCPHYILTHRRARTRPLECDESFETYPCSAVSTSEALDPEMKCQDGRGKPAAQQ